MNLSLMLRNTASVQKDHIAISWSGGRLTYADLDAQAQQIAGALLKRHGLKPGDRVALAMENCPEYFPLLYGIWRAGLSAVPIKGTAKSGSSRKSGALFMSPSLPARGRVVKPPRRWPSRRSSRS